jgi:hypothetical protein
MVRCKDETNGRLLKRRIQVSQRHLAAGADTKPFPWTVIGRSAALSMILIFNNFNYLF